MLEENPKGTPLSQRTLVTSSPVDCPRYAWAKS